MGEVQVVLDSVAVAADDSETNATGVNINNLNGAMVVMKVTGDSTSVTFNWYTKPEKTGSFDDSAFASYTLSNTDGQKTMPIPGLSSVFAITCTAVNNDTENACTVDAGIVANYKWG